MQSVEKRIFVQASQPYDVIIARGLIDRAGEYIRQVHPGAAVMVVTDSHVKDLCLAPVLQSLRRAAYRTEVFVFPAGEESKCAHTWLALLNELAEKGFTRSDLIVALGGGVTGDLAGFAASAYLRGIPYVQIPTTLLAMVDSSVGGKTAIDLPAGKNLCGAFYQPKMVLCDPDVLLTLPEEVFAAGCAEVIKYGFIGEEALLDSLLQTPVSQQIENVLIRCVTMKKEIVEQDERDTGLRNLLNFGHTFGHAIETLSGYTLSHGQAVAMGMKMMCTAAVRKGLCDERVAAGLNALLRSHGLDREIPYTAEEICRAALQDKKRDAEAITLVVPAGWGKCELKKGSLADVLSFAKEALKA